MGVGGSVVGRGGDLIIITDPHKSWVEVQSPTYRKRTYEWFESDVYTRREPNASIIIEHTRWHDEDLSGYLINEHGDDWQHIHLPALAEEDDILGRDEGEPLCPERWSKESLEKTKKTMIDVMWGCLYQQRPAPDGGAIINSDWFKYWDSIPEDADEWLQSWDCTFKKTGTSMVVGQVWCRKGPDFYLIEQTREKLSFTETLESIKSMSKRCPQATQVMVEDKANGPAIIDTLKNKIPGMIEEKPVRDKVSRLIAVSHLIKGGNVYIPDPRLKEWVIGYKEELRTVPAAKYDDQADATSQALKYLSRFSEDFLNTDFALPSTGARPNEWSTVYG
jgi:predicted phage terminase large subunit-like protein